jgi:EmrB/QacA subfamily drug resistance transporter
MTNTQTTNPTRTEATDGRWLALIVLCAGFMMIILDSTIVNVALPSIQEDLGFSQSTLAWVVNGYLIAFGGLLLLSGRLGDLIGRRRVFLFGLALFTAASLACGFASSQELLVGARFIQGIGGALTSAVILGMIVTMFPEPREQGKAIGIYSFVASAGASIGLLAGGALTQAISWHWIFFVNVPIGIATALLALRYVEDDEGLGLDKGADVLGALLATAAVMVGVYTVLEVGDHGWTSAHTLGFGAASFALLAGFLTRETRAATPMIPLRVFRSRNLSGASLTIVLMVAGMFGMFFLGVLYLQRILAFDAIETGLAFLPVSTLIGVMSLGVSARLNLRFGARATLLPGLVLVAVALAYFSRAPVDGHYVADVLPVVVLLGAGAGLVFPALTTISMSGVLPHDAGLASGVVNTSMQVGGAFGLAVLATLATDRT